MKTYRTLILSALVALGSSHAWAQTSTISSVSLATGVVTVTERIGTPGNVPGSVGNNLAGVTYAAGNIPGAVDTSISFFTLTGVTIPGGGAPADAFTSYGTLIGPPTAVGSYADVAPLLPPATSYSALAFVIDDLGLPIAGCFYSIHHQVGGVDYLSVIVPQIFPGSSVTDLKPMSWPGGVAGGPADAGLSGYFALAYASGAVTGYSANSLYYLRTDSSLHTQFGEMIPALTGASTDKIDLITAVGSFGVGGYTTLAYTPTNVDTNGANQFYYLRQDIVTGNTILGRLNPGLVAGTRTISDIANLGGVYNGLTFAADATGTGAGWGSLQFYLTGTRAATAQSISFAAIADGASGVPFTVSPSASSGLPITLTVVAGSATISAPVAGVFTVTPLAGGVITLEAAQVGGGGFDYNMLRQSFNASGAPANIVLVGTGDFDGDGLSEPLWRNAITSEVRTWFAGGGSLGFGTESAGWTVIGIGDFDGDGISEPLWHNSITKEVHTWFCPGGGYVDFGTETGGWAVIGIGDFDGDGGSEPLWRNSITNEIRTWFTDGSSLGFGTESGGWSAISIGDYDGDGLSEPLWHNSITLEVRAWFGGGSLGFGTESGSWSVIGTGDYNGDGLSEPLWRNSITHEVRTWFCPGSGSLGFGTESGGWTVLNMGDFDGDGISEPLWHNSITGEVYTWSLYGTLGFGFEGGSWSAID